MDREYKTVPLCCVYVVSSGISVNIPKLAGQDYIFQIDLYLLRSVPHGSGFKQDWPFVSLL